jgi:hypothetical protein
VRRLLPTALAAAFALSFWSSHAYVPAEGDSAYSLWSFEVVWHHFATLGPWRMFSRPFWQAPFFANAPLGLAFSENQLYSSLLLWPVRAASGSGTVALGAGAVALVFLAYLCAAGWLRALGFRRLCFWGALLFEMCGWLQSQHPRYQSLTIFLLPLALWAWTAFASRPDAPRLALCAFLFGWIGGWNLYFQVFANLSLCALVARSLWRRQIGAARLGVLLALVAAVEWPIAAKYLELASITGGYQTEGTYGATWASLLGATHRTLVPSLEVPVESAGYMGVVWLALMALSIRQRGARPWLLAAAVAFWASLGMGYGLFELLSLFPGVGALRASGRGLILVMLFSLPAVMTVLEALRPRAMALALTASVVELIPVPQRPLGRIDPGLWGPPTALSQELAKSSDPVLVLPAADAPFMLYATQSWTPYFGGFSSRAPAGEELLNAVTLREPWTSGSLDAALDLTRPQRVLALTPALAAQLRASPRLKLRGCYRHLEGTEPCLFDAKAFSGATLRLDRDASWEIGAADPWPAADLRATAAGALDALEVDRCKLRQTIQPPHLPPLRHDLHLQGSAIVGVRFVAAQPILHREARQVIFRLSPALRPGTYFEVVCAR